MDYDKNWAKVDSNTLPDMKTPAPGPKSKALHDRAEKYMKGYSSQVKLFPVAFESGHGVTLTDADGNTMNIKGFARETNVFVHKEKPSGWVIRILVNDVINLISHNY